MRQMPSQNTIPENHCSRIPSPKYCLSITNHHHFHPHTTERQVGCEGGVGSVYASFQVEGCSGSCRIPAEASVYDRSFVQWVDRPRHRRHHRSMNAQCMCRLIDPSRSRRLLANIMLAHTTSKDKTKLEWVSKWLTCYHGNIWMPTCIPDASSPHHVSTQFPHIGQGIWSTGTRVHRRRFDIDSTSQRGVQVVDVDLAIFAASINIARICAAWW